jgi:hypothetical protein
MKPKEFLLEAALFAARKMRGGLSRSILRMKKIRKRL